MADSGISKYQKMMDTRNRWKSRRLMAWVAFISGLAFPFFPIAQELHVALIASFYLFITGIVMAYIGFSTADDKWQKQ